MTVIKINLERYYVTNKKHTQLFFLKSNSTLDSVTVMCTVAIQQLDYKSYIDSYLVGNAGFNFIWKYISMEIYFRLNFKLKITATKNNIPCRTGARWRKGSYVLQIVQRTWQRFEKFWFNEVWESAEPLVHWTSDMLYLWLLQLAYNFTFRHFGNLKSHNGIVIWGWPSRVRLNVFHNENKIYADQKTFCNGYL